MAASYRCSNTRIWACVRSLSATSQLIVTKATAYSGLCVPLRTATQPCLLMEPLPRHLCGQIEQEQGPSNDRNNPGPYGERNAAPHAPAKVPSVGVSLSANWNQARSVHIAVCVSLRETPEQSDTGCPETKTQTQELHRTISYLATSIDEDIHRPNLSDMALRARTTKRARSQTSPSPKHVSGDDMSVYFRQPDNQHDDQPRRKRAMVSANLRFLEKMPPLRDYQRGRFGRRGGVDGGAPHAGSSTDGDSSFWMRALEESMEETSFVTQDAPTCGALVAPVPITVDNRRNRNFVPVQIAVMGAGRVGIPVTSPPPTGYSTADEDAIRRRRLFALQASRGGGKDDEARPATEGLAM